MANEIRVITHYLIDVGQMVYNAQICNKETGERWEVNYADGHEEDAVRELKGVMKDQGLKPDDLQELPLMHEYKNMGYYIDIKPSHPNG